MTQSKQQQVVRAANVLFQNQVITLNTYTWILYHIKHNLTCPDDETKEAQKEEQTKLTLSQEEVSDFKITENGDIEFKFIDPNGKPFKSPMTEHISKSLNKKA